MEDLFTKSVRSMDESFKRKSNDLEKNNEIMVFSQPDVASLPETKKLFG